MRSWCIEDYRENPNTIKCTAMREKLHKQRQDGSNNHTKCPGLKWEGQKLVLEMSLCVSKQCKNLWNSKNERCETSVSWFHISWTWCGTPSFSLRWDYCLPILCWIKKKKALKSPPSWNLCWHEWNSSWDCPRLSINCSKRTAWSWICIFSLWWVSAYVLSKWIRMGLELEQSTAEQVEYRQIRLSGYMCMHLCCVFQWDTEAAWKRRLSSEGEVAWSACDVGPAHDSWWCSRAGAGSGPAGVISAWASSCEGEWWEMVGVELCEIDGGEESMSTTPHEEEDDEERWSVGDWLCREPVTSGEEEDDKEDEGTPEEEEEVSSDNSTVSSSFLSSFCFLLGVASSWPAGLWLAAGVSWLGTPVAGDWLLSWEWHRGHVSCT